MQSAPAIGGQAGKRGLTSSLVPEPPRLEQPDLRQGPVGLVDNAGPEAHERPDPRPRHRLTENRDSLSDRERLRRAPIQTPEHSLRVGLPSNRGIREPGQIRLAGRVLILDKGAK